jgi:hypothetical protein
MPKQPVHTPDETSASGDSASRDGAARLAVAVGGSRSSENGAVVGRDAALIVEIRPLGDSGTASRRSWVSSRRLCGAHNSAVAGDHDHQVDTAAAAVANQESQAQESSSSPAAVRVARLRLRISRAMQPSRRTRRECSLRGNAITPVLARGSSLSSNAPIGASQNRASAGSSTRGIEGHPAGAHGRRRRDSHLWRRAGRSSRRARHLRSQRHATFGDAGGAPAFPLGSWAETGPFGGKQPP